MVNNSYFVTECRVRKLECEGGMSSYKTFLNHIMGYFQCCLKIKFLNSVSGSEAGLSSTWPVFLSMQAIEVASTNCIHFLHTVPMKPPTTSFNQLGYGYAVGTHHSPNSTLLHASHSGSPWFSTMLLTR